MESELKGCVFPSFGANGDISLRSRAKGHGENVPVLTELHVGLFLPSVAPNLMSVG